MADDAVPALASPAATAEAVRALDNFAHAARANPGRFGVSSVERARIRPTHGALHGAARQTLVPKPAAGQGQPGSQHRKTLVARGTEVIQRKQGG